MSESVKGVGLRRATSVVGAGTLISRILGLVREVVIAGVFGASGATDVFFVAFRIPNSLRRLLAEGGVTVAVQPVYTESLTGGDTERRIRFESALFSLLRVLLALVTVAGIFGAPALILLFAAGFAGEGGRFDDAVVLLRVLFPFVFFMGLIGASMGVLNARGRFFVPAFGPAVLNLGLIGGALFLTDLLPAWLPVTGSLAVGALVGVVLWWVLMRRALTRSGVDLGWRWAPQNRDIRETGRLLVPAVAGLAVYQLQVIVGTLFASYLSIAGVSHLSYADRIIQFPLALIGTAVGTVALPLFSRAHERGESLGRPVGEAIAWVGFLVVPATVGLLMVRGPAVSVLYERGAFGASDTVRTAAALLGYGFALIPAAVNRVLLPAFYGRKDMRTPVAAGGVALVVQVGFSLLWFRFGVLGLAGATAVASLAQMTVMLWRLARAGVAPEGMGPSLSRTAAATALMAAAVWGLDVLLPTGTADWIHLGTKVGLGGAIYAAAAIGLGHPEWQRVRSRIRGQNSES